MSYFSVSNSLRFSKDFSWPIVSTKKQSKESFGFRYSYGFYLFFKANINQFWAFSDIAQEMISVISLKNYKLSKQQNSIGFQFEFIMHTIQLSPDQQMQQLLQQFELPIPEIGCPSGAGRAMFLCLNRNCKKPALHCQDCKQCEVHIQKQCSSIRLKLLTFMLNKQNQAKSRLISKMKQVQNEMFEILANNKESMLKLNGFTYLNRSEIKILESIFLKPGNKVDICGKDIANILSKVQRAKEVCQDREQQVLKIYKNNIRKITLDILQLEDNLLDIYFGRNYQMDSKIIHPDALSDKEFIFQSLSLPLRPQRLELLFRASEHGYLAKTFHQKCDNIPNTFTIIRNSFQKVIAGYTPLKWNSPPKGIYVKDFTQKSFLLSITMKQKMILSNSDSNAAIYCHNNYGPTFGAGHDIHISDECHESGDSFCKFPQSYNSRDQYIKDQLTYELFCGATSGNKFRVQEYQVFKVIW